MVKGMQWFIALIVVFMLAFLCYKAVSQMDADTAKMVITQVVTAGVGIIGTVAGYLAGKKSV